MSYFGFNFRASSGFVTDGPGETYVIASDTYPTTRNGITFGWTVSGAITPTDVNSSNIPELAGYVLASNTTGVVQVFRVDLPATGKWAVRLAMNGQPSFTGNYVNLFDNAGNTGSYSGNSLANEFLDAVGAGFTSSTWLAGNSRIVVDFTSSIFRVEIGDPAGTGLDFTGLAHVSIEQLIPPPLRSAFQTPPWVDPSQPAAYLRGPRPSQEPALRGTMARAPQLDPSQPAALLLRPSSALALPAPTPTMGQCIYT